MIGEFFMMMCRGIENFNTSFDTAVVQYILDSGRSNYSLSALSTEYLHTTVPDEKEFNASNEQVDMFTDMSKLYTDLIYVRLS